MESWPYSRYHPTSFSSHCLVPEFCPLCFSTAESNGHLIIRCPFSWKLWGKLFDFANIKTVILASLTNFFSSWCSIPYRSSNSNLWHLCLHSLVWTVWKERYRRTRISLEISLLFGTLFCISSLVGLKNIVSYLDFLLNLRCNLRSLLLSQENDPSF